MASIVAAIKFYDDVFFDNEFYSKVAGVSCIEMNVLEAEILKMLSYELWVESSEYEKYKERVERLYNEIVGVGKITTGIEPMVIISDAKAEANGKQ